MGSSGQREPASLDEPESILDESRRLACALIGTSPKKYVWINPIMIVKKYSLIETVPRRYTSDSL